MGIIVCLSLIVVIAACLRLTGLTVQSLWFDELVTLSHSSPVTSFSQPIKFCATVERTPPLFYILLWGWQRAVGVGEYQARLLPALIGILGVISIFFLGRELFSSRTGLFAALITAVTPFHISYSQEVRSYSLVFLLTVMSFLFLTRLLKKYEIKRVVLYVLTASLLNYAHYFGLVVFASQLVFLAFYVLFTRDLDRRAFCRYFLPAILGVCLLFTPWSAPLMRMTAAKQIWIKPPTPVFFINYFRNYFGNEPYVLIIFLVLLAYYLISRDGKDNFKDHKLLLFSWLFLGLMLPYFRSLNHPSPLTPRNTIIVLPAIILMVSRGLDRMEGRKFGYFLLGTVILMLIVNIFYTRGNYYRKVTKDQCREVVEYVNEQDPKHRYPLFGFKVFEYYFNNLFKQGVEVKYRVKDINDARRCYEAAARGEYPGFWLLDTLVFADESVYEFLRARLKEAKTISLKGAKATLFLTGSPSSEVKESPHEKREISQ